MQNLSRTRKSIINLTTSMFSQIILLVLKFVCRTVFIHTLGKSYLGINGLFSDILTMLSLTELGLDTAINFKLYKPLAENDQNRIRVLMKFYKYAYIVVGIIILIIGVCLIPFLPALISDYDTLKPLGINPVVIFLLFLMQSVTSYLFWAYRSAIIKADQNEYIITITSFVGQVITNILQIIVLIVRKDFYAYTALVIGGNILVNMITAYIAKKMYPTIFVKTKDHIEVSEIKDIFKDLGALFIYKINSVVLKATDNIVLSSFMGLAVVGLYSNYLLMYTTIKTLLAKFFSAIKASMGNLYASDDIEKQYNFFEIMNFTTFVLYGTACVGIAVVMDEMLSCWIGGEYVIQQPFSILIGIEVLFVGIKNNLGQVRNVTGAFRQMWHRPLIGIVINLMVSILLVNVIGIYGVIIGTIAADFFANLLIDPSIIHKVSLKGYKPVSVYYSRNAIHTIVLFGIGAADMMICRHVVVGYGVVSVIIHALICAITVPLTYILVFWKRHECVYLRGIILKFVKGKNVKKL